MRRGFKAWCERTAADYRRTTTTPPTAALDLEALAAILSVRVMTPEAIPTLPPGAIHQLTVVDPASWSAVTISRGSRRLVILNSGHSRARRRSSLAHELAHLILNHPSDCSVLSNEGVFFRGSFDREQEEEANWLAGCLLVPRDGLLAAFRANEPEERLAERFEVSTDMIRWRLRITGVPRQVRRLTASGAAPTVGTR